MDKKQSGFTLIELVMVIVILGILAAVAIPKFIDLSTEAKGAAVAGVAGALASGAAVNYASRQLGKGVSGLSVCVDFSSVIAGGLPTGYSLAGASTAAAGGAITCSLQNAANGNTTWIAIGS